jgi:hypothetical protein
MMAKFLSDASVLPLPMKDRKLLRMSLRRALDLHMSGKAAVPPVGSLGHSAGQRVQRFFKRKRREGFQGRPCKASMIRSELWDWFCSIKRSVVGRISPKLMINQAKVIAEVFADAGLTRGEVADLPVIDKSWMHTWKHEYRVSFRLPNRKWKAPRSVLMERLRITWLNVIRVRALALATAGQDLPMWNFDQSPFHMNEAGSKSARSLCVCEANTTWSSRRGIRPRGSVGQQTP